VRHGPGDEVPGKIDGANRLAGRATPYCQELSRGGIGHGVGSHRGDNVLKGFKNFLMQGELVVIAVGLVVALAFSTLVKAFTDNIITPLINAIAGGGKAGKGLGWTINNQHINVGAFIAAIIYFVILMAVIYYLIVVPYRAYMKRRGRAVFGDPPPTKTCPQCQSNDIPVAATRCKYCASELTVTA
jgi:large conductance mechanosensitive channel